MDVTKHNTIKVKCQCQSEIEVKFTTNPDTMIHNSKFEKDGCANSDKTKEYLMGMEGSVLEKDKFCGKSSEVCHPDKSQSFTVPCEQANIAHSESRMEIVNTEMGQNSPLLEKSKKAEKCLTKRIIEKLNLLIKNLKENWKTAVGAVALVTIITVLVLIYVSKPNSLHSPDLPLITTSSTEDLPIISSPLKAAVSENRSTYINSSTPSTILSLVSKYEGTLLILAGGEEKGKLVNTVELYPPYIKSCLPDLPEELKWGSMELLGNSLLVCGGQNRAEQPVKSCWILDKKNNEKAEWKHHTDLIRSKNLINLQNLI